MSRAEQAGPDRVPGGANATQPYTHALTHRTRLAALETVVTTDRNATIYAFDPTKRGVEPPAVVAKVLRSSIVSTIDDLVADGDRETFDGAWEQAQAHGGTRVLLSTRQAPDEPSWWTLMDLRSEAGCMIVIIGSPAPTAEDETLTPRQCRMRSDAASVISWVDDSVEPMLGYAPEELIGGTSVHFLDPDFHDSAVEAWVEMLEAPGRSIRSIVRYRRADGSLVWVEVTNHNRLHDLGWIEREILDVTEQMEAVLVADDKDRVLSGIADVLPTGIAQFDMSFQVVFANHRWEEMTGLSADDSSERYPSVVIDPDPAELFPTMQAQVRQGKQHDVEVTIAPADGSAIRRCRLAIRAISHPTGEAIGFVASLEDVTESWRLQQRLVEQATRDRLTGLANRSRALDHLDEVLAKSRGTDRTTAVVFIDLNEFKRVNDVLGHTAGDHLLREIASNIDRSVRPGDLVARHGGDEFLIVCEDVGDAHRAMEVARRILNSVTGRYLINGELLDASASCGVAIDVGGYQTAERVIAEADLAMYEQKRAGHQDPGLFKASMFEEQREELNRDSALARAAEDDSLVLHYQPIIDLQTGQTVGYEALLRWMFEGTLIAPDQFIGLAERRGLIVGIGDWVLDEVCRQASQATERDLLWSLNVSPIQLRDSSFDSSVAEAAARHGVAPHRLALELTEGVMMANDIETQRLLARLNDMGVQLLVDDFGTGYASLDYLRTYPVSGLKIDRCFTADLDRERTRAIVANVVGMADSLGLRLVVEGIETEEQADVVRTIGGTTGQGYLFGRPAPLPSRELRETSPLERVHQL